MTIIIKPMINYTGSYTISVSEQLLLTVSEEQTVHSMHGFS